MCPATPAARAALALLLLAAAGAAETAAGPAAETAAGPAAETTEATGDPDSLEYEVESAPFAVVVEHSDGWRCGGALISMRVALSSATCARGRVPAPAPPADLWARAPAAPPPDGARRVARIALATDINSQDTVEGEKERVEEAWLGVALDLALLELEAPFGAAAHARPVLMASARDECEPRAWVAPAPEPCVAVRTLPHDSAPLRAAAATPTAPAVCAARASHWPAIADQVLCFTGPQLCSTDWGVGVVCAGKLCGVVSRSARAAGAGAGAGAAPDASGEGGAGAAGASGAGGVGGADGCGDTHAALLVPRWREFVHCAQAPRSCGRDACAAVCSERWLLEEPGRGADAGGGGGRGGGGGGSSAEGSGGSGERSGESAEGDGGGPDDSSEHGHDSGEIDTAIYHSHRYTSETPHSSTEKRPPATRRESPAPAPAPAPALARAAPTRTAPLPPPQPPPRAPQLGRARLQTEFEFEPNRADFKMGEYGDNVANYESVEDAPTRSTAAPAPRRVPEALVEQAAPATTRPATTTQPAQALRKLAPAAARSYAVLIAASSFCIFYICIYR